MARSADMGMFEALWSRRSMRDLALLQTLPPSAGMVPGQEREPGHDGLQGTPLRR
jgi:hypothetical protein